MTRPAGRFVCNAPGCTSALEWAEGVFTVEQQLAALRRAGWVLGVGRATCGRCVAGGVTLRVIEGGAGR